jgi:hypothetical protein
MFNNTVNRNAFIHKCILFQIKFNQENMAQQLY